MPISLSAEEIALAITDLADGVSELESGLEHLRPKYKERRQVQITARRALIAKLQAAAGI